MKRHRSVRLALTLVALAVVAGCSTGGPGGKAAPQGQAPAAQRPAISHMHGLGYPPDGSRLFVAAHDGFVVYANGKWEVPNLPAHDYMGFSPADNGFYSSGHPAPGSGLKNPLGLVKSGDWGKSLTSLGFEGAIDFHLLGVGYKSHAIYVANPQAHAKLPAGVHYSVDDGKTWKRSALQGVSGELIQIAVHPTEPQTVALATERGLFLSHDYGQSFAPITTAGPVTAAVFSPSGDRLFFGLQKLSMYELAGKAIRELPTPSLDEKDGIAHLAVNPATPSEIALGTFDRSLHLTRDLGKSWTIIAERGKTLVNP